MLHLSNECGVHYPLGELRHDSKTADKGKLPDNQILFMCIEKLTILTMKFYKFKRADYPLLGDDPSSKNRRDISMWHYL